ncbi:hypothetical protein C0966_13170 [Bacillus methanolicus]|nr:hypothetical protein [Bacillus methanolicus]
MFTWAKIKKQLGNVNGILRFRHRLGIKTVIPVNGIFAISTQVRDQNSDTRKWNFAISTQVRDQKQVIPVKEIFANSTQAGNQKTAAYP